VDVGEDKGYIEYQNVPPTIGAVVSGRLATLYECQTLYGVQDIHDMLEVLAVDAHNRQLSMKDD
jgi:hypothetical protein